ncbi:MAG: hypothetical protein ACR2KE_00145 [Candidatus Nanopelagicales bacterium]
MTTPEQPLAKAPDADVHPVAMPSPSSASAPPVPRPAAPVEADFAVPTPSELLARKGKDKDGRKRGTLKAGKGRTTADALMGASKDKLVDLGVRVPKSVRKRLKAEAKARGVSPDDIVTVILDAALGEQR